MDTLFTGDKLAKAIEKIFLLDRFVQWTGERKPELYRFLDVSGFDGDNLKIYKDNGYYVVPVGSWIVRAPDGAVYPFGEGVRFVSKEEEKILENIKKEIDEWEIPINREEPITTYIPEDPYETEVVEEGNAISLRRKLDKDGKPILKKNFGVGKRWNATLDTAKDSDWTAINVFERKNKPTWIERFNNEARKWNNKNA